MQVLEDVRLHAIVLERCRTLKRTTSSVSFVFVFSFFVN